MPDDDDSPYSQNYASAHKAEYIAWHFDGHTAVRRAVTLDIIARGLLLNERERRHGPFAFDEMTYIGQQSGAHVYGLEEKDGWRLGIAGEVPKEIADFLPTKRRYGGWIDRLGIGPAAIGFTAISAAIVAAVLLAPQWLAPLVPQSFERDLGDALVGDFGGRFCTTPDGSAALTKMTGALIENPEDLQIEVANIDMVNAIALPGGKVILFKGLLNSARSPDEVAGVLAHEVGHVRERHVMQGLLRQLGLSVILGGADGMAGGMLNSVLSMSYSREAERAADSYSIAAMKRAEVSPLPTAGFFRRLSRMDGSAGQEGSGNITGYMSSHPLSSERKKAFEQSAIKGKEYQPVLNAAEWNALKEMCNKDKDVADGFGLFD